MKIIAKAGDLTKELTVAAQAASRKQTIPILSNVLIEAEGPLVTLTATDLDVGLVTSVEASVEQIGKATISAAKLLEIVKSLPVDADVILALGKKGGITLDGAGFSANLQGLPPDDFPVIASPPNVMLKLPRQALVGMLARTRYAIADEDNKHTVPGVLLDVEPELVRLVSTDGHRLVKVESRQQTGATEPVQAIIPKRAADALPSLLDSSDDETIEFAMSDNHLFFRAGGRLMVARQIDGKFPAYQRVIPKEHAGSASVSLPVLLGAVQRSLMLVDDKKRAVKFRFAPGRLTLSAESVEVGDGVEGVAMEYAGPELTIGINGRYVQDFLDTSTGEQVRIEVQDEMKPPVFRQVGGDIDGLSVIMPIRL